MAKIKVGILPSNQHLNAYAGMPGITEETWATKAAEYCKNELVRQGYDAQIFHVKGTGSKSTDELNLMINQALAWNPDFLYSLHSDAATGVKDIFPLIRNEADRTWGTAVGKELATRLGMPLQYAAVRESDLMFFYKTKGKKSLLMEIGRHNVKADAKFNMDYAAYEGIMAARAFIIGSGLKLKDDGPVLKGVAVPPGQEKYAYVEPPKEMPEFKIHWLQRWRFLPFTSDKKYVADKYEAPIFYLQWKLNKIYTNRIPLEINGKYDLETEQVVRIFQLEHGLVVDGVTSKEFWGELLK